MWEEGWVGMVRREGGRAQWVGKSGLFCHLSL